MNGSMADRFRWVLDQQLVSNQKAWASAAGLSEGAVRVFLMRAKRQPAATMGAEELAALATAAGVAFEWLATGRGTPTAAADERGPFDAASEVFLAGAENREDASAWLKSAPFRMPGDANARQMLDILEGHYARHLRARAMAASGSSDRAVSLALGGVGARIEAPDDDDAPRTLEPLERRDG